MDGWMECVCVYEWVRKKVKATVDFEKYIFKNLNTQHIGTTRTCEIANSII